MNLEKQVSTESLASHIRILIVDDHEVMRLGIRNLLEAVPHWNICAEASSGREAIDKAFQYLPDVIIMDITMPGMNGLEAAAEIGRSRPDIPVILFSLHLSEDLISHFESGGIRGAVSKGEAARDLVEAVKKVLAGGTFFPSKSASRAQPAIKNLF
jgi:DNA-binding NarL/FixJ family response regulator